LGGKLGGELGDLCAQIFNPVLVQLLTGHHPPHIVPGNPE
jgi:hypothetical protein